MPPSSDTLSRREVGILRTRVNRRRRVAEILDGSHDVESDSRRVPRHQIAKSVSLPSLRLPEIHDDAGGD